MATFRLAQVLQVHDAGVGHLVIEVVALAGALTHAGEHRQARVRLGDVVDQLHHVDGLADAGAAEQADLAALGERAHQVDHLDAGFQQFLRGRQFVVGGSLAVDRGGQCLVDRAALVDRVAQHVHDAAQRGLAHGHRDGGAGVVHHRAAAQAVDEPSAIVRTTPSPSCCCTSSVSALPSIFSASYTRGMCSRGNSTSTTAPMHWTIFP
jgi:peptide chain release factor 1